MGTNFYLMTRNKTMAQKYAPYSYELTDTPYFGYEIHIAKTSGGWLPLFQGHRDGINSVHAYKEAYHTGEFDIVDEYGSFYTWAEFTERVLKFNGGVRGVMPLEKVAVDKTSRFYDPKIPDHIPISHFDYQYDGYWANDYFADDEGYEFDSREFS